MGTFFELGLIKTVGALQRQEATSETKPPCEDRDRVCLALEGLSLRAVEGRERLAVP